MARRLLAGVVVAATLVAVGSAAAGQAPIVRSAKIVHRHVVLMLSVGELRPVQLTVATRRAVDVDGVLLKRNVRLQETIRVPASATGVVRWQSRTQLRSGVFFVQVTAVETGDVTGCPPKLRNCNERWSNVRRVIVPASK